MHRISAKLATGRAASMPEAVPKTNQSDLSDGSLIVITILSFIILVMYPSIGLMNYSGYWKIFYTLHWVEYIIKFGAIFIIIQFVISKGIRLSHLVSYTVFFPFSIIVFLGTHYWYVMQMQPDVPNFLLGVENENAEYFPSFLIAAQRFCENVILGYPQDIITECTVIEVRPFGLFTYIIEGVCYAGIGATLFAWVKAPFIALAEAGRSA